MYGLYSWAGFHCYVLLRGVGVAADPTRARRCFEWVVTASDCSSGSPWLPRLELAVLWLSGRGGPVDPARAEALLADCYQDGTYVSMLQRRKKGLRAMAAGRYEASEATMKAAWTALKRSYEGARMGAVDGQRRKLLDQAQHALVGYRKAEIELYILALSGQHPEQSAYRQVSADLSRARSQMLEAELQHR